MNTAYYEENKFKLYTIKFNKGWILRTYSGDYIFNRFNKMSFFIEDKNWMIIPRMGNEFPSKIYLNEFLKHCDKNLYEKMIGFLEEDNN